MGPFVVSPDGRWIASADEGGNDHALRRRWRRPPRTGGRRGRPILWSGDGRWLYLLARESIPARVHRREVATGRLESWREIGPADLSCVMQLMDVLLAEDASSYVYSYGRIASELPLAEGLR